MPNFAALNNGKMLQFIKQYKITCALLLIIWVLCFIPLPETPLSGVRLIDKWTHIVMYLVLGLSVCHECSATRHKAGGMWLLVCAWLLPTLMGGLIELLQAYCTGGRRSGDWLDFAADALGTTFALPIGILWARFRAKP